MGAGKVGTGVHYKLQLHGSCVALEQNNILKVNTFSTYLTPIFASKVVVK